MEQSFAQSSQLGAVYDFSQEITKQKFLDASGDKAVVYFESATKRESGPEFRDYNAGYKMTFNKVDGKWLFAKSEVVFVDYSFDEVADEAK